MLYCWNLSDDISLEEFSENDQEWNWVAGAFKRSDFLPGIAWEEFFFHNLHVTLHVFCF